VEKMRQATSTMAEDAAADWLYLNPVISVATSDLSGVPVNAPTLSLDLSTITR
jgi:peptide/nickel transport system substrate-binding protein